MFQRPKRPDSNPPSAALRRAADARPGDPNARGHSRADGVLDYEALQDEGGANFGWEFEDDARLGSGGRQAVGEPVAPPQGAHSRATPASLSAQQLRREAARISGRLEQCLDRWWTVGELPSEVVLREGLFFLRAGGTLPEAARVLLLRTSLAYGRGWQTALHYCKDAELSALVVAEALVMGPDSPVEDALLDWVVKQEDAVSGWREEFKISLRRMAWEANLAQRRRAVGLLDRLEERLARRPPNPRVSASDGGRLLPVRRALLFLLLLGLVGYVIWERVPSVPVGMVLIPEGTYTLPTGAVGPDAHRQVSLSSYWIDRTEVTNSAYRRCVAQGVCRPTSSNSSVTQLEYFLDGAFDGYPVVNVSYAGAEEYCVWQGGRLPTTEEWQVAAAVDGASGRAADFPWGPHYATSAANGAALGVGDTLPVGSFRPAGDSPYGLSDMAGNVAEWTLGVGGDGPAVVKGGSYRDEPLQLKVWAKERTVAAAATSWIGFRCARSAT